MLGPTDVLDWTFDECDALRADIRRAPVFQRNKLSPSARLSGGLKASLRKFNSGCDYTAAELADLLQRLNRAETPCA